MPPRLQPHQQPADPPTRPRSLRAIVGGYDGARLPLTVQREPDELLQSWMWRAARTYEVTPRALLSHVGIDLPPQRAFHPGAFTEPAGSLAALLGSPPELVEALTDPLARAQHDLLLAHAQLNGHHPSDRLSRSSGYCPHCLEENPVWRQAWISQLTAVCTVHSIELIRICPRCDEPPFIKPSWLTSHLEPTRCPIRNRDTTGRYSDECNTPLNLVTTRAVTTRAVEAQTWFDDLARQALLTPEAPTTAAGIEVTAQVVFEAALEIHQRCAPRNTVHPAGCPPPPWLEEETLRVRGIQIAFHIFAQQGIAAAAFLARRYSLLGLESADSLAPYGATEARVRPHNPLLLALAAESLRARDLPALHLTYRLGSTHPGPPRRWNPRVRTMHPVQALGALPLAWIPQRLWEQPDDEPADVAGRTLPALLLARYGSGHTWGPLAAGLGLPAWAASLYHRSLCVLRENQEWGNLLRRIDELYLALHRDPPTIDYLHRRIALADPHPLIQAADTIRRHHPSIDLKPLGMARDYWALYTQGDLQLAPGRLRAPTPTLTTTPIELLEEIRTRLNLDDASPLRWQPP